MRDRWKRGILPFETHFYLSRYAFSFPRYRRVKKSVIFDRLLLPSLSFIRASRSRPSRWPIPNCRQATDAIPGKTYSFPGKKCASMDRAPIHEHCIAPWKLWILVSRSRYRDESKSNLPNDTSSYILDLHLQNFLKYLPTNINNFQLCDYTNYKQEN